MFSRLKTTWKFIEPFPPELEARFRERHNRRSLGLLRAIAVIGICGYLLLLITDLIAFGEMDAIRSRIIFFFTIPMLAFTFVQTYFPRAEKRYQWSTAILTVMNFGITDVLLVLYAPGVAAVFQRQATVLFTIVFYTCLRLRYVYAAGAALAYTAIVVTVSAATGFIGTHALVTLVNFFIISHIVGGIVSFRLEAVFRIDFQRGIELAAAHAKSEELLLNILPRQVADRLRATPGTIADHYENVTVMFADLVNFTPLALSTGPQQIVELLNGIFSRFDALAEHFGVEKIKTIGDAYMACAGLPDRTTDHALRIARMALAMQDVVLTFNASNGTTLDLRIGVNTGPVVAGVIGQRKFIYDLWGDTVNLASRMESHGEAGLVQVAEATALALEDLAPHDFVLEDRGIIEIKGRGGLRTFWLHGPRVADRIAS